MFQTIINFLTEYQNISLPILYIGFYFCCAKIGITMGEIVGILLYGEDNNDE